MSSEENDFPRLTDAYHKAKRNLAIASRIFLAWEYVGIRVGDDQPTKASAELPMAKKPVTLINP